MTDKQLKDKAINIKGKSYVLVADRVAYFNETYDKGAIETIYELIGDMFIVRATVHPVASDATRSFTGHSQATIGDGMVNKTAALENAETSAVGRALGLMGIGVIDSIASMDEMNKAKGSDGASAPRLITDKQMKWLLDVAKQKAGNGVDEYDWLWKLLTVDPAKIPVYKFKDALALVQKQPDASGTLDTVVEVPDEINLDEIPY